MTIDNIMKVRNTKTGKEITILDIATKEGTATYIEDGILHQENPSGEWEIIDESAPVDWDAYRREVAKAAMEGILASGDGWSSTLAECYKTAEKHSYPIGIARFAIACADELIRQLKGE